MGTVRRGRAGLGGARFGIVWLGVGRHGAKARHGWAGRGMVGLGTAVPALAWQDTARCSWPWNGVSCMARLGEARLCRARRDLAGQGGAWRGPARFAWVGYGEVECGGARRGSARQGAVGEG